MTQRLIRIALALVVAFVFTGRFEAAAEHCARLVYAAEIGEPIAALESDPCHGMHEAVSPIAAHEPMHDRKTADHCDCIAVLNGYAVASSTPKSSRAEPYAWERPQAAAVRSIEPAPDWRPPRA